MSARKKKELVGMRSTLAVSLLILLAATPFESPVADAAQRGEVDAVRALLKQGADPNEAQPDGMTGLHWSALNDEPEIAELLLYAGANVQPTTRLGGYTPLHLASRSGHEGVVIALLEGGADPNFITRTGVTPTHFAAEANAAAAVQALIDHGADLNAPDGHSNRTPLMFAAARNAVRSIDVLVAAGADVAPVTSVRDFAKIEAADREERARRARIREAEKDPEPETEPARGQGGQGRGGPPAAGAGRGGPPGAGAPDQDPKPEPMPGPKYLSTTEQIGTQGGFSALHYAARNGHLEAANALVRAGSDVNQMSGDESTPLLVAVINGNYDLAADLLEAGADPNLLSDDGAGPALRRPQHRVVAPHLVSAAPGVPPARRDLSRPDGAAAGQGRRPERADHDPHLVRGVQRGPHGRGFRGSDAVLAGRLRRRCEGHEAPLRARGGPGHLDL